MKVNYKKLVISLSMPFLAGFIGSYFTNPSIPGWYESLNKPFFNPPNWLFGPVWTILYLMMGISFYLIYTSKKTNYTHLAHYYYFGQLALNSFWSIAFFGIKNIGLALIVIFLLSIIIFITILLFEKIEKTASYLLIPYFLWVLFATLLNFSVYILNWNRKKKNHIQ